MASQKLLTETVLQLGSTLADVLNDPHVVNGFTIAGTLISGYVLLNVWGIRKDFLFVARLPQIQEALQEDASALSALLNDFEDSKDVVQARMEILLANLQTLLDKLSGRSKKGLKRTVIALMKQISHYRKNPLRISKDHAREIYTALNGVIQQLKNITEDQKWSTRDAG